MARLIIARRRPLHDCHAELARDIDENVLGLGSIAECSCNRRYALTEDQREGFYWALYTPLPKLKG